VFRCDLPLLGSAELILRVTAGAARTTVEQKKALATQSHAFNLNNKKFRVSRTVS